MGIMASNFQNSLRQNFAIGSALIIEPNAPPFGIDRYFDSASLNIFANLDLHSHLACLKKRQRGLSISGLSFLRELLRLYSLRSSARNRGPPRA
jgi:hypothetical protein